MEPAPRRRAYKGGRATPDTPKKCAWVVLLMIGKSYAPGALVIAQSLRDLKTKHDLVCMVTDDVPAETRDQLRGSAPSPIFDHVIEVPYIAHPTHRSGSKKQAEMYGGWIDRSFTKWNCLTLTQYDRVILIDADTVAITNCDDLFELRPPAACYTSAWAYPWQARGGLPNPYLTCAPGTESTCDLPHGARITAKQINKAVHSGSFVGIASSVLLEPSAAMYEAFLAMLRAAPVFGAEYNSTSGADEVAIAVFYAREAGGWTNIHQRYQAIPWKRNWVSRDIRAYHYHGRKPWEMDPGEWPDLADWWKVADRIVAKHPALRALFRPEVAATPLDADIAQLRITNDLRALLLAHVKENRPHLGRNKAELWQKVDGILGRWAMALVNAAPGEALVNAAPGEAPGEAPGAADWGRVYRSSTPDDGSNKTLAGDLFEAKVASTLSEANALMAAMLKLVAYRLRLQPAPTGIKPQCGETFTYGSHFTTPTTPRIAQLTALGGCDRAAAVVLRYAVSLNELQACLPQAHADKLYEEFGVRNEAFASPLDARLFGKKDAIYFSLFPDTDAAFGSSGNFFSERSVGRLPGNWLIHPPQVGAVILRAAKAVTEAMCSEPPCTVFFLVPICGAEASDACEVLRGSPFYTAELKLGPDAIRLETPAGAPAPAKAPHAYIVLSGGGIEASRLNKALCGISA